jgi:hypothetical protein
MADYTYAELMKMQNDAIKRVEDMQKRARKTAGFNEENDATSGEKNEAKNSSVALQKDVPKRVHMPDDYLQNLKEYAKSISDKNRNNEENNEKRNIPEEQNRKTPSAKSSNDGVKSVLGDIKIDEDKALLLSLVLLLSEENADETLILALLYMLS